MDYDSEQTSFPAEIQSHSESYQLKLNFAERNLQRVKQENTRISHKIGRLEEENAKIISQNKALLSQIEALQMDVNRAKAENEVLIRKLEVRTQRHQMEQTKNISLGQKQVIEKRVRKVQAQLHLLRDEKELLSKKHQSLLQQLQREREEKKHQQQQIISLQKTSLLDMENIEQVEQLYKEKINILQSENSELKKQLESLVLEVKLFERKKEIENLLDYQNRIDLGESIPSKKYEWSEKQNRGSFCCCQQLQEELLEREELIDLLKERNSRLNQQVQSVKQRCATLQGIICKTSSYK